MYWFCWECGYVVAEGKIEVRLRCPHCASYEWGMASEKEIQKELGLDADIRVSEVQEA